MLSDHLEHFAKADRVLILVIIVEVHLGGAKLLGELSKPSLIKSQDWQNRSQNDDNRAPENGRQAHLYKVVQCRNCD